MKKVRQFILLLLFAVALLPFCAHAQPVYQTSNFTNSFDNDGNTGLYQSPDAIYWYSLYQNYFGLGYNLPMTNDCSMDAESDTNNSGSLYVYSPFTNGPSGPNQDVFYFTLSGLGPYDQSIQIPLNLVTNISFKIHVDPSSKTDANGDFGTITCGLIGQLTPSSGYTSGANSQYYQGITIPGSATNGWVKLSESNPADAQNYVNGTGITNGFGVDFDYNSYGGYPTSPVAFWIDDVIVMTSSAPPPPPPPPTNYIAALPTPGLTLFASQGTSLYQRESIETVNTDYSWIGASAPVTYSYTISDYSVGKNDAFQTQIFLIPNPGTESAPDYNEPNLVFFDMESTTNGATMLFRYKTNQMDGNSMVYGSGTLAQIHSSTALGTWTATMAHDTNVTMTAPDGTTTNFNIPDATGATSALFSSGVALYFGSQAGNAGGTADHITASQFSVSGLGSTDFTEDFVADATAGVLSSVWETNATYAPAVQLVAPGSQTFLVEWTSPALNYSLNYATNLNSPINWQPYLPGGNTPTPTQFGPLYSQIVNSNVLPVGSPAFFELSKP